MGWHHMALGRDFGSWRIWQCVRTRDFQGFTKRLIQGFPAPDRENNIVVSLPVMWFFLASVEIEHGVSSADSISWIGWATWLISAVIIKHRNIASRTIKFFQVNNFSSTATWWSDFEFHSGEHGFFLVTVCHQDLIWSWVDLIWEVEFVNSTTLETTDSHLVFVVTNVSFRRIGDTVAANVDFEGSIESSITTGIGSFKFKSCWTQKGFGHTGQSKCCQLQQAYFLSQIGRVENGWITPIFENKWSLSLFLHF